MSGDVPDLQSLRWEATRIGAATLEPRSPARSPRGALSAKHGPEPDKPIPANGHHHGAPMSKTYQRSGLVIHRSWEMERLGEWDRVAVGVGVQTNCRSVQT